MTDKYAIIKLGGKQFMVKEGDVFSIERQSSLNLNVLLFADGKTILVGSPEVTDVKVKAEIVKDGNTIEKTRVGRFRNKSRYRKIKGHKQPMSTIKINSITNGEEKAEVKKPTPKKKAATKKVVKSSPKRKATAKAAK